MMTQNIGSVKWCLSSGVVREPFISGEKIARTSSLPSEIQCIMEYSETGQCDYSVKHRDSGQSR